MSWAPSPAARPSPDITPHCRICLVCCVFPFLFAPVPDLPLLLAALLLPLPFSYALSPFL